jgi:hypothetical protein
MNIQMTKSIKFYFYIATFIILVLIFQLNILRTTSDFQFKTYRDGSEALVLGKIVADKNDIATPHSNLGFLEKDVNQKGPGVLSIYERFNNPKGLSPLNVNDQYWTHGWSNNQSTFVLPVANTNVIGYMPDELKPGETIEFLHGGVRTVTATDRQGNFLNVSYSGSRIDGSTSEWPSTIKPTQAPTLLFDPYPQQFGIQGLALSFTHRYLPAFNSVFSLQLLMSAALALTLVVLSIQLSRSISPLFGIIFLITMIGSPWIVSFARNLYWATFLWFLPAVFAAAIFNYIDHAQKRRFFYAMYFIAIFIKCLAGYEYITSVVLLSLLPFMIAPFETPQKKQVIDSIKHFIFIGITSLLAFTSALILHAANRADSITKGLMQTLSQDALKYSSVVEPNGFNRVGPDTPLLQILKEYIFDWNTPVLFWATLPGLFACLIAVSIGCLLFQYYMNDRFAFRDTALLFAASLSPLSWFVLMQRHAAIHINLDYVLWYFGFVPAVFFVIIRSGKIAISALSQRANSNKMAPVNREGQ